MINKEQEKAIKSLARALKKCQDSNLGIFMEDFSIYAADKSDLDEENTPWDYIRKYNTDYEMIELVNDHGCCRGAGGA